MTTWQIIDNTDWADFSSACQLSHEIIDNKILIKKA